MGKVINYEQDIKIDETALDVEWTEQADLMMKYVRHAAEMRKAFDLAKEDLDLRKSELDKAVRSNPDKYDIEKVTEGAILSTILTHEDYIEANNTLINAQFELNVANGAVRAVDCRKDALENLVRLHGQSYFAGPQIPRDIHEERLERQKKLNASIASKITPERKIIRRPKSNN